MDLRDEIAARNLPAEIVPGGPHGAVEIVLRDGGRGRAPCWRFGPTGNLWTVDSGRGLRRREVTHYADADEAMTVLLNDVERVAATRAAARARAAKQEARHDDA